MTGSAALARVEKGKLCSGCGLCASIAPNAVEISVSANGYLRPHLTGDVSKEQDSLISRTCPGLVAEPWEGRADAIDPYWGPIAESYTGYSADEAVRFRCSSGGAISSLAAFALEEGLVDKVVHVIADPSNPVGNAVKISGSTSEVLEGAGSRYAPSAPLENIRLLLEEGEKALFIGKPCDVSALRRLARHDERVDETFPYMLSFFCGGIPSLKGAERIIEELGLEQSQVAKFDYRGNGWPGLTVAEGFDGTRREMTYERSWGQHLSSQVQFRCKICADPVGGVADIACADAWYGGETGYPQFEEADGRSLVLARSVAGSELLSQAVAAGKLVIEPLPITEINLMQPAQARRKRLIWARMKAWKMAGRPVPLFAGMGVEQATRKASLTALAKEFLGTARRIIKGRI